MHALHMIPHYAYSPSCTKDYVQIYLGLDMTSASTFRLCGSGHFVNVGFVSSPGFYFNEAFVHYHTDESNTAPIVRGFEANFVARGKGEG